MNQKQFSRSFIEAYNIVERRMNSSAKTTLHQKILIFFADNIGITIRSDLVRLKQILCFFFKLKEA